MLNQSGVFVKSDSKHSASSSRDPDAALGGGSRRRHYASLESYLDRFEAERILEAQSTDENSAPMDLPPRMP